MDGAVDFDLEYRFYDGKTRLDAAEMTRRFLSLHLRAVALEEKGASWDALETQGLSEAIRRINAVITPLIVATQAEIGDLNAQIAAALAEVEAKIVEAEQRLDTIIAGGLPAADVAESTTRVFVTPAQRAEIGSLRSAVNAILQDATAAFDTFAEVATALGNKLDKSAKATTAQAQAGTDDAVYMTPKKTVDAIGSFAGFFKKTVFTTGGAFTKDPKTKWLLVEPIGGGGSGAAAQEGAAGGGCGGTYVPVFLAAATVPASVPVTIGDGGYAVSGLSDGIPGGTTSFGSLARAVGGSGGSRAVGAAMPVDPLTGTNRAYNFGNNTQPSAISGASFGFGGSYFQRGGQTINGGGGGAGSAPTVSVPGGQSLNHGAGGDAGVGTGNGFPGQAPGGAGGGAYNGSSGAGARGELCVWEFG